MAVQLNHTIVHAIEPQIAASFLSQILGLAAPRRFGPFWVVDTSNGVSLDFEQGDEPLTIEHYAFLVSEAEFDEIFGRIKQRHLAYWADPAGQHAGEINHNDGGRGVYFRDPSGHYLEIITRPYGSGAP
jgi:catechol 2,3-dioxygenase-like lactoylglutathione lyase family enzyme